MQEEFELETGVTNDESEALPASAEAKRKSKGRGKGKAFKHFKQGQRKKDAKKMRKKGKS